jgi:hypothetical protein
MKKIVFNNIYFILLYNLYFVCFKSLFSSLYHTVFSYNILLNFFLIFAILRVTFDLRSPTYCAGQRVGGQAEYEFLMSRYVNTEDGYEQSRLLNAMGCASDEALLQA